MDGVLLALSASEKLQLAATIIAVVAALIALANVAGRGPTTGDVIGRS